MPRGLTAVLNQPGKPLDLETLPTPEVEPGGILIKNTAAAICGSDLHYWRHGAAGLSILKEPMLLGHEIVGVVRQGASDGSGPTPGTPVAVHPARPGPGDGSQRYPADRPNLSPGCAYLGSAAHRPHTQGGFAHYVTLGAHMLRPLPAGLALRTAAVAEPASVAWHAVGRAGDVRGRSALVIGAGPIGALVVAVLRRAGAAQITVVDLHEAPLERARALGATRTLLAADRTALAAVQPDVTVESSGSVPGLTAAITNTARGGRVVMLGLLPPGEQPVPMATAIERELELTGSFRFNDEIDDVLQALADGSLDVEAVVTHEYAIEDALTALHTAADPVRSGKVLLRFG